MFVIQSKNSMRSKTYVELLDSRSATFVGSDHLHLHDLDGVSASTMAGTHIPI